MNIEEEINETITLAVEALIILSNQAGKGKLTDTYRDVIKERFVSGWDRANKLGRLAGLSSIDSWDLYKNEVIIKTVLDIQEKLK